MPRKTKLQNTTSKVSEPAFPTDEGYSGLSERDYIAIEALGGMLAHAKRYKPRQGASKNWHEAISEEAYQLADAMLAERIK